MDRDVTTLREASIWLSIVSQLFVARMNRILEPHGMTLVQFSILNHLARRAIGVGNRIMEIAEAVEAGQPAVTKTVAKFEAMELVETYRVDGDQRSKHVRVLPKGKQALLAIQKDIGPALADMFGVLGDEEMRSSTESLRKLGKWLDENRA